MKCLYRWLAACACALAASGAGAETFVLVHGAFQDGRCWDQVAPLLKKAGHQVVVVNLPGRNGDGVSPESLTLAGYADGVVKTIKDQGVPVVLVGHSFGGMTISAVAEAVPGLVKRLVYVSAYLPQNGQSLQALSSSDGDSLLAKGAFTVVDGKYAAVKADSRAMAFGNDARPTLQQKIVASLISEPLPPLAQPVALTAEKFGSVRKNYVMTLRDNTVSTSLQRRMIAATPVDQVFEIDSGHAPYMTAPAKLAEALLTGTSRTVFEKPAGTFFENLLVEKNGDMLVTSHEDGLLLRIKPEGKAAVFAQIPGKPASVIDYKGGYLVAGWAADGKPTLFAVTAKGEVSVHMLVEGAAFLNGIAHFTLAGRDGFLITDSYRGLIWFVDPVAKTSLVWLEKPDFSRIDEKNPSPGINGLKAQGARVLVTNSQRQSIYEIPVSSSGQAAGDPRMLASGVPMDDFAIASDGSLVVATHPANSIIRVSKTGQVTRLAGVADGLVGVTSVAFGRRADDKHSVYVTTNGGLWAPLPSGVQPARVVRVDLSAKAMR